jgi:sulfonate transport system substrate-binding protein
MLAGVRQENARGSDTSLLQAIVDETEEQLGRELKGQPEVEADLRETLGQVYLDIGQFASAALMHETALNLRRQVFGPAHFKVGDSLHFLGDALARQRKYAEAETALRAAIALRNNLPGSKPASVDESRAVLNRVLRNAGRVQETPPTGKPAAMPEAIRILAAITRPTGEPANLGDIVTMARTQGVLEGEFAPDGVEIAWLAVGDNAAVLRQRGADFHVGGGRGFGAFVNRVLGADVPIKVVLRIPRTGDAGIHLAVRADSPFQTLADLKGHRLACTRGGGYLKMALLLEKHGFSMKDFEMVLVDSALVLRKALLAGDADSIIMLRPIVELGAPEAVRLILSSGPDAVVISGGALCVRADFEQRHPAAVQRVVTALVKLAAWHSEAKNRDAIFELWARSGLSRAEMEQHWAATPLKERYSPLMDEHYFAIMRREVEDEKRFGFLPADANVNIENLAEPKYLRHALAELNLEGYWPEFDQQGQPKAAR